MEKHTQSHNQQSKSNIFNGGPLNKSDLMIYEESDHFVYLLYHKVCRAMIGKANILNRFDEWEVICHNCKRITPIDQIKFVRIEKRKPKS